MMFFPLNPAPWCRSPGLITLDYVFRKGTQRPNWRQTGRPGFACCAMRAAHTQRCHEPKRRAPAPRHRCTHQQQQQSTQPEIRHRNKWQCGVPLTLYSSLLCLVSSRYEIEIMPTHYQYHDALEFIPLIRRRRRPR